MSEIQTIDPREIDDRTLYKHLIAAVGPRPIAFASTIDKDGITNLSPFSFFNVFSGKPPILVFSPALRGRDGSKKDTLRNVEAIPQVVINVVNFAMAEQMSLSSVEFRPDESEFERAGFTPIPSHLVAPPRVAESPIAFECEIRDIVYLDKSRSGGGVLVIGEVVLMHVKSEYVMHDGQIACEQLDLIGRMGGNWYSRATGEALFQIEKPRTNSILGFNHLPAALRESNVLTGSDLARLAALSQEDADEAMVEFASSNMVQKAAVLSEEEVHFEAKNWIKQGRPGEALALLMHVIDDKK